VLRAIFLPCVHMRVNIYAEGTDKRAVRCEGGRRRYVRRGRMHGNCLVLRVHAFVYHAEGTCKRALRYGVGVEKHKSKGRMAGDE